MREFLKFVSAVWLMPVGVIAVIVGAACIAVAIQLWIVAWPEHWKATLSFLALGGVLAVAGVKLSAEPFMTRQLSQPAYRWRKGG